MKTDMQANGFDEALNGWVRAAFVRGVRTFPELVRSLPGVYPADALHAVRRLRQELPADWQQGATSPVTTPLDGWVVEHPLDFDWRFTPEAARLLINRCRATASDSVAFLGAPSLAGEAAACGWPAALALFDQNPAVVEAIRASFPGVVSTCLDLVWGEPVANGDVAVAVADPPWYSEHTVAFLWAASRLTRLGGRCASAGVFRVIVAALGRREDAECAVAAAIGRDLLPEQAALVRRAAVQVADLVRGEERELAEDAYRRHERDLAKAV